MARGDHNGHDAMPLDNATLLRVVVRLLVALHRAGRAREAHLQVFEGGGERGAPDSPPPGIRAVAGPVRPAELPRNVRRFTGRVEQLGHLDAHLGADAGTAGESVVWLLHGIAGVGKTALAVHWAHRVRDRFPDGRLYVDLRGYDADREPVEPAVVLAELLRALGADPMRIPAGADEQTGLYRSLLADKQVLLVLDNARDAAQVLPLLPPTGTVLVTSRHRLSELVAATGAWSLLITALPAADSRALLSAVLGSDRVRAEPDAVDELARLCEHLPLALRIAAANIAMGPDTSIRSMAAELADEAGQNAVTRAFAVSYETLVPELQRLFRLLGVASCLDFTAETVAALTGDPAGEVAGRLRRLAAAHLVEQYVVGRYRLHELLRGYALEQAHAEMPGDPSGTGHPA